MPYIHKNNQMELTYIQQNNWDRRLGDRRYLDTTVGYYHIGEIWGSRLFIKVTLSSYFTNSSAFLHQDS